MVSLLVLFAGPLERQGHGCIAVVTSVAGDRGRRSNYVYGAAKGAVALFLQGLRARLARAVVTIKAEWVDTPMLAGRPWPALVASPEAVARRIHRAILRGEGEIYVPWFWRPLMWLIRALPAPVLARLPL